MIFTTQRLIIRNLKAEDFEGFHEMQNDPEVMKYTGSPVQTAQENKQDLDRVIKLYDKTDNVFWVWAIERKLDGAFVGTCAIVRDDPRQNYEAKDEIGYRFLRSYWGNGYGNEITEGLLKFAFTEFGKELLIAEVDELNAASVKILDRHMHLKNSYFNERDQSNDRYYEITKSEFLERQNKH